MKRGLKIDFVESAVPRWVWRVTAVGLVLLCLATLALEISGRKSLNGAQAKIIELKAKIHAAQTSPTPVPKDGSKRLLLAEKALTHDWNGLFSFLESIEVQGVRLIALQATVEPAKVRAEFQVNGWETVANLNELLNVSADQRWELVSVSSRDQSASAALTAVWER